jgi:hypothetical protein
MAAPSEIEAYAGNFSEAFQGGQGAEIQNGVIIVTYITIPAPPVYPPPTGNYPTPPSTPSAYSPWVDVNTGDLVVMNGQLVMAYGTDFIRQSIKSRLMLFQGEYLPNLQEGMPWFQSILIKGYNPNVVRGAFINRILGTLGVQSIVSINFVFNTSLRSLQVNFQVQTNLGLLSDQFLLPLTTPPNWNGAQ